MDTTDAVVIGAGAVGLAVAKELAQRGLDVIVLEAATGIGTGISSRNSEVIHAGIYYPTGSLKAQLCVRGKQLLYDYCAHHGVTAQRCTKLIVATRDEQIPQLHALRAQAEANGVDDLRWLEAEPARTLEPALFCVAALHSPSTGIFDSHAYMLALQGDLQRAGGVVAFSSAVQRMTARPDGFLVHAAGVDLLATRVVNAAGLSAPWVAQHTTGLAADYVPQAYFAKGNYFSLTGRAPFSRLVYPIPESAGLGVHLTLDLGGQARFGPDVQWLTVNSADDIDYAVEPTRGESFYASIRRYWPGLPDGALQPAYSGVRPKISAPGAPAADFVLQDESVHGLKGLMNLFGIESPGLTSSLALAEYVADRLL